MSSREGTVASVIADYFDAKNRRDDEAIYRAFLPSASVRDEQLEYTGAAQIHRWIESLTEIRPLKFEVLDVTPVDTALVATVRVSGDVPGSPFTVRYAFTLSGAMIARLEIDLARKPAQNELRQS